jgi:glutaredoxin
MSLTVYSKSSCPQCDKAKSLLSNKGINFDVVDIEQDASARQWLIEQGHRTVPQIYVKGELFVEGGWQGLSKLNEGEILQRMERYAN